jgi:putative serine protease PepD
MGVKLDMTYTDPGAKVQSVTSGSPSAEAGLRSGDIITKVNGRGIDDATELVVEIRNHVPGEKITVGYTRDGKDENATLILGDDSTTQ